MLPPKAKGRVVEIQPEGGYNVNTPVIEIDQDGKIDIDEAKDLLNDVTEIKKEIDSIDKEHKDGTN